MGRALLAKVLPPLTEFEVFAAQCAKPMDDERAYAYYIRTFLEFKESQHIQVPPEVYQQVVKEALEHPLMVMMMKQTCTEKVKAFLAL